jgi:PAS domain S-box-containing protein
MARSTRRGWFSGLALALGCAFLITATVAVVQLTHSRQTEALLAEITAAHRNYTEAHEALSELNERVQEWVLLAGDPAEAKNLETALARADHALLALVEHTPPPLRAELPTPALLDHIVKQTRLALPELRTEADLEAHTHAVDAQIEKVMQRCDQLDGARASTLENQIRDLQTIRFRQARLWFVGAIVCLLATLLLAMRQLRELGREEGAERERVAIVERISDGFMALDRQWRYVYVNAAAERQLGRKRGELLGRVAWDVFPGKEAEQTGEAYRRVMETQRPESYETYSEDGHVWYETRLHPSPEGLAIYFRDVTEERRMRERLAASEARHRQIVETAQEGIWTFGPDGGTSFVNRKLAELLGYSPEEMLGKPLFAFMDAEGQRIAADNLQRRALGLRDSSDFKFVRKDGEELWALMATSPLEEGSRDSILAMLTDISERRRTESERTRLAARERNVRAEVDGSLEQFRVLSDLVPHMVWSSAGDGYTEWINRAFEVYSGLPMEQAIGTGWQGILHPADVPAFIERWQPSLLTGAAFEARARLRRADGVYLWHTCRMRSIRAGDGRIVRWFGIATADPPEQLAGPTAVPAERARA